MKEDMKQLMIELGRSITELNYQRDRLLYPDEVTDDLRGTAMYEPWWYSGCWDENVYTESFLPQDIYTNYN